MRVMNFSWKKIAYFAICGTFLLAFYQVLWYISKPKTEDTNYHFPLRGIRDVQYFNNNINNNNDNKTKLLIVSYKKSGASFLGKVFDVDDEVFYVPDPLWYLCNEAVPGYKDLTYLDGTRIESPESCRQFGPRVLEAYWMCNIDQLDTRTLTSHRYLNKSKKLQDFVKCGLRHQCVRNITRVCLKTTTRVIKTINVRLKDVEPLLKKYPELKVVHLVRDPRGVIHSTEKPNPYSVSLRDEAVKLCGDMMRDMAAFKQFRVLFPGRILQLRYEDLCEDLFKHSQHIYTFIDITLPASVKSWITGQATNNNTRLNPKTVSYRWRHLISWYLANEVFKHCEPVLADYLYEGFVTEHNLRNKDFPLRMEMCFDKSNSVSVCPKY